jgi:hypothetical protein
MRSFLSRAWNVLRRNVAKIPVGNGAFCTACDSRVGRFIPYRKGWKGAPPLMISLEMVGSDLDRFSCPKCGAHDRERHLMLYFEKLGIWEKFNGARILHFAPEPKLYEKISVCKPAKYILADLYPTASNIQKVDIHNTPFEADFFDFVICNHVLEHVADDQQALSEIFRILKKGGLAILQTPYSAKLKATFSDPGIDTDDLRLQIYGQEDHVRLFGADIVSRFESCGLISRIVMHKTALAHIQPERFGVNAKESLFLFEKHPT